jgi:hypothetical protein
LTPSISSIPSYTIKYDTIVDLEMIFEGIGIEMESSKLMDNWRNITSYHVLDYWEDKYNHNHDNNEIKDDEENKSKNDNVDTDKNTTHTGDMNHTDIHTDYTKFFKLDAVKTHIERQDVVLSRKKQTSRQRKIQHKFHSRGTRNDISNDISKDISSHISSNIGISSISNTALKIQYYQEFLHRSSPKTIIPDKAGVEPFTNITSREIYINKLRAELGATQIEFNSISDISVRVVNTQSPSSVPSNTPSYTPSKAQVTKMPTIIPGVGKPPSSNNNGPNTNNNNGQRSIVIVVSILACLITLMIAMALWFVLIHNKNRNNNGNNNDNSNNNGNRRSRFFGSISASISSICQRKPNNHGNSHEDEILIGPQGQSMTGLFPIKSVSRDDDDDVNVVVNSGGIEVGVGAGVADGDNNIIGMDGQNNNNLQTSHEEAQSIVSNLISEGSSGHSQTPSHASFVAGENEV